MIMATISLHHAVPWCKWGSMKRRYHILTKFVIACTESSNFSQTPVQPVAKISSKWHFRFKDIQLAFVKEPLLQCGYQLCESRHVWHAVGGGGQDYKTREFPSARPTYITWNIGWRQDIERRSASLALCEENPLVIGGIPSHRGQ